MAEDVERTEEPTARRRQEARREGQIAISQEVFIVANLLGVSGILLFLGTTGVHQGIRLFHHTWQVPDTFDPTVAAEMLRQAFGAAAAFSLPVLMTAALAAIGAGILQTRGNLAPKRLRPKFSKLSPAKNLSRLIKHDAPIQLGKSLVKLVIVGGVIASVIIRNLEQYAELSQLPLYQVISFQLGTILHAWLAGCAALLLIAIADYAAEHYRTEKQLKMTRQEVRDEHRQSEGDPHVKARLRSLQMERTRTRMMEQVPKADVVVTNPDHVSVALLYQRSKMRAPKVVAKGRGLLALRIREIAREFGVPIVRNPPVARALYRSVKVDRIIPEKLYQVVAELLAYVHRLDRTRSRSW